MRAPEAVADKLHWLALTIGHLADSYNKFGMRRWFQRRRSALGNRFPQDDLLTESNWTPEDEAAQRIAALAMASMGMTII